MEKNNSRHNPEESSDLQNKTINSHGSDADHNFTGSCSSTSNIEIGTGADKAVCDKEEIVTLATESSGSLSRLRRRRVSFCPPKMLSAESHQSSLPKKKKMELTSLESRASPTDCEQDDQSKDSTVQKDENNISEHKKEECKNSASTTSIALDKIEFDIKIDPNVVDKYTDSGFTAGGSTPESPETRRQRIDIISRQCRLHPTNKKYNQGPVENPPLVTPGKLVGYTPGGQRHEVDLNCDRPTWFNSEYARMQWDYATRVNVSRMFHELETGNFLPDCLDTDIERRYFAMQELATKEASEHFQEKAVLSSCLPSPSDTTDGEEKTRLLSVELQFIEVIEYATVRLQDFAGEVGQRLRKTFDLPLTSLMIKKNPDIVNTLEVLATQSTHLEVVFAARALLNKIKGLFQVPEGHQFRDFFVAEVEKLKEKTKHMSGYDILMMTEEPSDALEKSSVAPDEPSDAPVEPSNAPVEPSNAPEESSDAPVEPSNAPEESSDAPVEPSNAPEERTSPSEESPVTSGGSVPTIVLPPPRSEEEMGSTESIWIPIENGDNWVDIDSTYQTNQDGNSDDDLSSFVSETDDDWESETTNDDSDDSELTYPSESDDETPRGLLELLISGTLTVTIEYNYFEYI